MALLCHGVIDEGATTLLSSDCPTSQLARLCTGSMTPARHRFIDRLDRLCVRHRFTDRLVWVAVWHRFTDRLVWVAVRHRFTDRLHRGMVWALVRWPAPLVSPARPRCFRHCLPV
jgi:hypothetical protein